MNDLKPLLTFLTAITLFACSRQEALPHAEKHWIKVEIAGEHAAVYSIYGDINQSLFVTLYDKILNTTDGGKTWRTKLNSTSDFGKIEFTRDTLFAIGNNDDYFSTDAGETWQLLDHDIPLVHNWNLTAPNGTMYQVKMNFEGELALPSNVLESCNHGLTWKNIFPYQHYIYSVYADPHNALYIGVANTFVWNESSAMFDEDLSKPAAFYYSK